MCMYHMQLPDQNNRLKAAHLLSLPGGQARLRQRVEKMSKALQNLGIININDEYGTPRDLYEQACIRWGVRPQLDVCTNLANAKCESYWTIQDDALRHEWDMDFFMNPPYSMVREFMEYAYEQHKKHNVDALILVYAKTDTRWWHDLVEGKAEIHFVRGRIRFNDMDGNTTKNSAPYPSVWIIWRKK